MRRFSIAVTAGAIIAVATSSVAANNAVFLPVSAPTLGEAGLGLLVVLVAAVGAYLVRRKK